MKTETLARDSLQTNNNKMFTVLYEFMLYAIIPIAFEMSFVKIFQRSMEAYSTNDSVGMCRLVVYFIIQWVLGILVRKQYLKATYKRMTLALLILMQVKEAFIEEVFFDMVISMIMESGMMVLLFFKFANLMVLLKAVGVNLFLFGAFLMMIAKSDFICDQLSRSAYFSTKNVFNFIQRIHVRMMQFNWNRSYCS